MNYFENNSAKNGGAFYYGGGLESRLTNSIFKNNTASENGGALYSYVQDLHVRNNAMVDNDAGKIGNSIYSLSRIYNSTTTILNNGTVIVSEGKTLSLIATHTDDMGNNITGSTIVFTFNNTAVAEVNLTDDLINETVYSPGKGTYLVSTTGANYDRNIVKTALVTFESDSYSGPFYVATDGDDSNIGDETHPFKTLEQALFNANLTNNIPSIVFKNGSYNVSNVTIDFPVNMTGLGDVKLYGDNSSVILNVSKSANKTNITNISFIGGNSWDAGAINLLANNCTIENCTFINNTCTDSNYRYGGGAIAIVGNGNVVNNSNFINNSAKNGGGAVFIYGSNSSISNSNFTNNTASRGGAISDVANSILYKNKFTGNVATSEGGAIYLDSTRNRAYNDFHIINSTFIENSANEGGAIFIDNTYYPLKTPYEIINSSFSSNTAKNGASIYNKRSNLTLANNTMLNNKASDIGNDIYDYFYYFAYVNNTNVVVLNNETVTVPEGQGLNITFKVTDDMGNKISGGQITLYLNKTKLGTFNVTDDSSISIRSPGKGVYLINGTYNKNNYTFHTAVVEFLSDPYDGPFYVSTNGSDVNDGSIDYPFKTIEKAIEAASRVNSTPVIYINGGVYNESNLIINKSMNISTLGDVVIDAKGNGRILNVSADNVNISGITFENAIKPYGDGGAIYWSGKNGNLTNATFINNTANRGGAIVFTNPINITGLTFINNSAINEGGAIYSNNSSNMEFNDFKFINNSAKLGGAVFIDYSTNYDADNNTNKNNTFTNNLFENNTAQMGGALVVYSKESNIENNTFIGNNATRYGSGALVSGGYNNTIINNTFINNTAFLYAGAIGTNDSLIANNSFINNSAYQAGAILTINSTIVNNSFENNNATTRGTAIGFIDRYRYDNITCNCSLDNYSCCGENCTCKNNGTCNCTNHTNVTHYSILINNTGLGNGSIFVYNENRILNVTKNMNGVYYLSDINSSGYTHWGFCIEENASYPWLSNGTTGIEVENLEFVRNSLNGENVAKYIKVLIMLNENEHNWNIKDLIYVFTDGDYLNSDIPEIQDTIRWANDEGTILVNGDNYINGTWYCHVFSSFVNPTTRQNLILINGCGMKVPNLTAEKTANATTIDGGKNGQFINYTVTVYNTGDVVLHNVTVVENNKSYLSYSRWENTYNQSWVKDPDSLTWHYTEPLGIGKLVRFNIIYSVGPDPTRSSAYNITNEINVTSYETDYTLAEANSTVYPSKLVVYKSTIDTNVSVGDEIRYLITVKNIGNSTTTSVVIEDSFSGGNMYPIGSPIFVGEYHWSQCGPVAYSLAEPLAPGASASIILRFKATSTGTNVPNTVYVRNYGNQQDSSTNYTNISSPTLYIKKTTLDTNVSVGDLVRFALTVSNPSNYTAYNFTVNDPQFDSAYLRFVGIDTLGDTHWAQAGQYAYRYSGALAANSSISIIYIFNATKAGINVNNTATVTNQFGQTNTAHNTTNITNNNNTGGYYALHVKKVSMNPIADINETVRFLITVYNDGTGKADYVRVQDSYSVNDFDFISYEVLDNRTWSVLSNYGGSYNWEIVGGLEANSSSSILVTLKTKKTGVLANTGVVIDRNHYQNYSTNFTNVTKYWVNVYKNTNNNTVSVGNQVEFTISLSHQQSGPNDANITGAYFDEIFPDGLVFDSYIVRSGNWTHYVKDDGVHRFILDNALTPHSGYTVTIICNVTKPGVLINTVNASSDVQNNTTTANKTITATGLYIQKIANKSPVNLGDAVEFTIRVTNTMNSTIKDVFVIESPQEGLTYLGYRNQTGGWIYNGNGNWTYDGELAHNETGEFVVIYNSTVIGNLTNTITVYSNETPNQTTNTTVEVIKNTTYNPSLTVEKIALNKTVYQGEIVQYIIRVNNTGDCDLYDVFIVDDYPSEYLTLINYTDNGTNKWFRTGNKWVYYGPFAVNSSSELTILFNATKVGNVTNTVTAGSSNTTNQSANNTTEILKSELIVEKIALNKTVYKGNLTQFTIKVTNRGGIDITDLFVKEDFANGLVYVNFTDSSNKWYYNETEKIFYYNGSLAAKDTTQFTVIFNTSRSGNLTNKITVGSNQTDNENAENKTEVFSPSFEVLKIANNKTVYLGNVTSFTIRVTNTGDCNLTNIYVEDRTPTGLSYLNYTNKTGNWTKSGSVWSYVGTLAPNAVAEFTIYFNTTLSRNVTNYVTAGTNETGTKTVENKTEVLSPSFSVIKIANEKIGYVGKNISYTIRVNNTGNCVLSGIFVEDKTPTGLIYLNYENTTGKWNKNGNIWNYVGTLAPNAIAEFTVYFNTTGTMNVTNFVTAGTNQTGNKTADNTTEIFTPSFTVEKIANDKIVFKGNTTSYVIRVTNTGDCNLTGIFVEDKTPTGLVYVNYINTTGKWNKSGDVWNYVGSLAPNGVAEFTVIFNTTKSMNITNVVTAGTNQTGNETAENNTTVVYSPSLSVEKLALNKTVYNGNTTEFIIRVKNTGDYELTKVFVEDTYPSDLIYLNFVDSTGKWSVDSRSNGKIKFVYNGTLAIGSPAVEFRVIFNTTKSGNFTNRVTAGSNETINKTAENKTEVFTPSFTVVKKANDKVVYKGNTSSYTITVTNTGDCNLTGIFVEDKTPEGLVYVNYVNTTGKWNKSGNVWNYVGSLAPNGVAEFTVIFNTTKSMNITNFVTAGTNQTGNETAENNTTVVYSPSFTVEKLANDEFVYKGNTTSYKIRVTNTGDCNLTGIFVEDKTPEGLVYVNYINTTGKWNKSGNVWNYVGSLAPNGVAEFTVIFNTTKSMNITNFVTAGTNQTGNETAENNTTVVYSPSLSVEKITLNKTVYLGNTTQFIIRVTNTGDCDLTGVFVEEDWDEGLIDPSFIDDSKKWFNNGNQWIYNDVLHVGNSTEFIVIFNTTISANLTNRVIAGSNETGNESSENKTEVFEPKFTVVKKANDKVVYNGNTTSYTITVTNTGNCNLTGIFVEDKTPEGLVYVNYINTTGKWNKSGNVWNYVGSLAPNGVAEFTVIFNTTKSMNITNFVTAGTNQTGNETAENNTTEVFTPKFTVEKLANDEIVFKGNTTSYVIRVTNTGDCNLTGIFVEDKTPEGLVYVNYINTTGKWNKSGNVWNYVGSLAPNGVAEFTVIFNTTKSMNITNVVTAGTNQTGNETTENNTTQVFSPSLAVEKITLNKTVYNGNTTEFTIRVINTGDYDLTEVFVEDTYPSDLIYLNFVDSTGKWSVDSYSNGKIKFVYNGTFAVGSSPLEFNVIFNTTKSGNFTNHVVAGSNITGNETSENTTEVFTPSFTVVKKANDKIVYNGNTTSYTITVTNTGDCNLTGVFVEDKTPEGLVYVDYENTTGKWNRDGDIWTYVGTLVPNDVAEFTVIFNTTVSMNITNVVTAGTNQTGNETAENNTTVVYTPKFTVEKLANDEIVFKDNTTSYVIRVTNTGDCNLTGVFVEDKTPEGLVYVDYENTTGKWDKDGDVWTYVGSLAPNAVAEFTVIFNTTVSMNITNVVTAGSNETGNETAENNTTQVFSPSLAVEKITLNKTVYNGNTTEFTIRVINTGDYDLTEVFVEDTYPSDLIYLDLVDDSGKWSVESSSNGKIKFVYNGTFAVGSSPLEFNVIFNTTKSGNFTNHVVAGSNITGNETSENTTEVFTPKMEVIKIANDEIVYNGNTTSYTITVTNTGDCNLTGVFVEDKTPEGLVYVDYENTTGKWDKDGDVWTYVGSLAPNAVAEFTVIFNTTVSMNITNVVTAGSNETGNETAENNTTIVYSPKMEVVKIANDDFVYNGNITTFDINVTNTGDCPLTGVFVEDIADEGIVYLDFVDESGKWSYDNETGIFYYDGALAVGESVAFTVIFNTTKSGNFTNHVTAGSDITGNETSENTTEVFTPKMEVIKIANDEIVYNGNTTSYTITVTNTGDCNLTGIFVEDKTPEGLIYVNYNNVTGAWDKDGDIWSYLGTLVPGESASFEVIFNTTVSMNITNFVTAGSNQTGNETAENNTTEVFSPALSVVKVANDVFVYNGNVTSFTIIVKNIGDCPLTEVFVKENVPDGLVYLTFVDDSGKWSYDSEAGTFYYDGALAVDESVEFDVVFNTTRSGNFTNVVVAGSNITGNETADNTTEVFTPKMEVVKVANDEIVYNGNTTSYTITVTNTGDCNLTGVFVEDKTPEGLVYIDYVNTTGTWNKDGDIWTYVGSLAPGESASFEVIFNTTVSMNITNVVVAGSDITGNKTTDNNTTVVYSPDFEIEKIESNEIVYVGNITSYTIRLNNTGDCDLVGVFVEEELPDGTIYLYYANKTGEWTFDGVNKWTLDSSLAPGESAEFEIFFNTTKSCNIVNVIKAGTDITGNKITTNNKTFVYSPSLTVQKITLNKTVYKGEKTEFMIVVTNNGDCDLTGVYVIEKSFPGLKYASYVADGWTFDGVNKWTYQDTLAPGESASFIVIFDTDKVGNFTNTVEAGSDQTGVEEADNVTEVIDEPVPPKGDVPAKGYKHGNLSDIKTGNPILVLLLVLAILGFGPVYRKRE